MSGVVSGVVGGRTSSDEAVPRGCDARSTFAGLACRKESVIAVLVGCVHEHIVKRSSCQWHVEQLAKGQMLCGACLDVDGHDCPMSFLGEVPSDQIESEARHG